MLTWTGASFLPKLLTFNLKGNNLNQGEGLQSYLALCPRLQTLDLSGNPLQQL